MDVGQSGRDDARRGVDDIMVVEGRYLVGALSLAEAGKADTVYARRCVCGSVSDPERRRCAGPVRADELQWEGQGGGIVTDEEAPNAAGQ